MGFGIGDSFAFISCPALGRSVGPEERAAERCGEQAYPPSQLLLAKAPLPFRLDEVNSSALEMGWFGFLRRGKKSLKQSLSLGWQGWGGFPRPRSSPGLWCLLSLPDVCCSPVGSSVETPLLFLSVYFKVTTEENHGVGEWCQMLRGSWTRLVWSTLDNPSLTEHLLQKWMKQTIALIQLSCLSEIKHEAVGARSGEIIKDDELKCS